MPFSIETTCTNSFESHKSFLDTLAFFSDFEEAIGKHFYGLESFRRLDNDVYRWTFNKLSYSGFELQIQFNTRFEKEPNRIRIVPVKNDDKAMLTGHWEFTPKGKLTEVKFQASLLGELPLPGLMKSIVTPAAQKEVRKIFDRYIDNVKKILST